MRRACGPSTSTSTLPTRALAAFALFGAMLVSLVATTAAHADAFVPRGLAQRAEANPNGVFHVIVQGAGAKSSKAAADEVGTALSEHPGRGAGRLKRTFTALGGV